MLINVSYCLSEWKPLSISHVSFGEGLPTFDLCSEVQTDCGPDFFCFNSDNQDLGDDVAENIRESESEGLETQRSDIDGNQSSESESLPQSSDNQDLGNDVAENIIESESEGLGTQRSDIDVEQTPVQQGSDDGQQPVDNDDDSESQKSESSESESESLPPLRTRRGRAIRKPRKFGFDD